MKKFSNKLGISGSKVNVEESKSQIDSTIKIICTEDLWGPDIRELEALNKKFAEKFNLMILILNKVFEALNFYLVEVKKRKNGAFICMLKLLFVIKYLLVKNINKKDIVSKFQSLNGIYNDILNLIIFQVRKSTTGNNGSNNKIDFKVAQVIKKQCLDILDILHDPDHKDTISALSSLSKNDSLIYNVSHYLNNDIVNSNFNHSSILNHHFKDDHVSNSDHQQYSRKNSSSDKKSRKGSSTTIGSTSSSNLRSLKKKSSIPLFSSSSLTLPSPTNLYFGGRSRNADDLSTPIVSQNGNGSNNTAKSNIFMNKLKQSTTNLLGGNSTSNFAEIPSHDELDDYGIPKDLSHYKTTRTPELIPDIYANPLKDETTDSTADIAVRHLKTMTIPFNFKLPNKTQKSSHKSKKASTASPSITNRTKSAKMLNFLDISDSDDENGNKILSINDDNDSLNGSRPAGNASNENFSYTKREDGADPDFDSNDEFLGAGLMKRSRSQSLPTTVVAPLGISKMSTNPFMTVLEQQESFKFQEKQNWFFDDVSSGNGVGMKNQDLFVGPSGSESSSAKGSHVNINYNSTNPFLR